MTTSMVMGTEICLVTRWVVEKDGGGREDLGAMRSQHVMGAPNNVLTIDILACAKLYKGKSIYKYNYDVGDISKSKNLLKGRSIC